MNWRNVKLIFNREVRDQLRDRRTLFMIAVLPLLLYPLLGMSFFQIAQFMREQPVKVLVLGAGELETLPDLPPLVVGDRFDESLFTGRDNATLLKLEFPAQDETPENAEQRERQLAEARYRVQTGDCQVVLEFPPDFAERLQRFRSELASTKPGESAAAPIEIPSPMVYFNTASEKSQIAYSRVTRVLDQWIAAVGQQNLVASRVPLLAAKPFDIKMTDVASQGHQDAAIWSKVLPFVLLIWALTGAFYPAIDLCAGEKERGTLETLLSSPAERSEIVWGKLFTVMLFSVVTAVLNLASMGLTGTFILSNLKLGVLGKAMGMPPVSAFLWLGLALAPIAALFSALCLALAALARSTKEGQYYLMPLVLVTMPLMILPMAPGVELTLGNSLIPVTGVVLLLRTMLEGNYIQALPFVVPVAAVTLACCLLAIRWAIDQFNQESVLFSESERLDLGLWVRQLLRDRGPTPTVGEAIVCFVLILLTQFFMSLSLPAPRGFSDFITLAFISQVVIIALPALLMTIMLTRRPFQTLLLHRIPALLTLPGAVLLALTLHPLLWSLQVVVQHLYPLNKEVQEFGRVLEGYFAEASSPWLPLLFVAVLPAVCEELAFRGFILSGLRHLGHKWGAILLSAVFFGMAHSILQQSLMAALVGILIGYVAIQTGSLLPCMLFHMTHNSLALLASKISVAETWYGRYPQLAWFLQRNVDAKTGEVSFAYGAPLILLGAVVASGILYWLYRLPYQKTREEQLQDALKRQDLSRSSGDAVVEPRFD